MVTIDPVSGVSRFAIVPAAYVFLVRFTEDHEQEVLLQLRQNTGYMDDRWGAGAAGHVERGETAYDAAQREAREELGLESVTLTFETTMQRTQGGLPIDERVDFFFSARSWTGEPRIMEPTKCAELRWWPLAALPDTVVPHERLALSALGTGERYLTFGFDRSVHG